MSCAVVIALFQLVHKGARAQEATPEEPSEARDVLLSAPEEMMSGLTAALQIEVSSRGARVIPIEQLSAPTLLLRDAEAQRAAIESGAYATARLESDATGWTVHVVTRDAAMARRTPIASDVDPRTIALIVVSLLEDPSPLIEVPEAADTPEPAAQAEETVSHTLENPTRPPVDVAPERSPDEARLSGRIGTGSFGLINDQRFIPGGMVRGGFGLEIGLFEGALMADAALMIDELPGQGSEIQPLMRACIESGVALPLSSRFSIHAGARFCGGFAEFRADLEAAWIESSMHEGEVFPAISTLVSMF